MQKAHINIDWENYPSLETPINESNLNKMDKSIDEIDNRVISMDITKFDKSDAQLLVKTIDYDDTSGIFTITYFNGTSITLDTIIEKIAVNFDFDVETQRLILMLSDGEQKFVDLSALITQYEFLNSDTVAFGVDTDGKVTAIVKEGSIEEKHLQPNYLADCKIEVARAKQSADEALISEGNAKQYAENASKSKQQCESYKDEAADNLSEMKDIREQIDTILKLAEFDIDDDGNLIYTDDIGNYEFEVDDDGYLNYSLKGA